MKLTKLIISTPTIEDWRAVMRKLLDEGCSWWEDEKEIYEKYWKEGEAIRIRENELEHEGLNWYKENDYKDYKFLTAQEFLGEEREFKVRDKVEYVKGYKDYSNPEKDVIEIGMRGKIVDISDNFIGVEWEKKIRDGHNCEGHCEEGYGYYVKEENIQLLKEDPKCEEITLNPFYGIDMAIDYEDNLPHEGKIKKMKHYLLRKLSANKRVLYKKYYINDNLSLTEKGKETLMDILADKYEKEMVEIAKEEKEEEE